MSYVVCDILASYCNGNWINLYIQNLILAACILAAAWRTNPSCLFSKWSKHSPSQDTGSVRVWRPHHRDVASAILHHLWPLQCRAALLRAQHRGSWIKKETKQEKRGLKPVFLSAKKNVQGWSGTSSSAGPQEWEDVVAQGLSSKCRTSRRIPNSDFWSLSDGISRRIQRKSHDFWRSPYKIDRETIRVAFETQRTKHKIVHIK